jgi:hypothetical protein
VDHKAKLVNKKEAETITVCHSKISENESANKEETEHKIETTVKDNAPIVIDSCAKSAEPPKQSISELLEKATKAKPKSIMLYLSDRSWSLEPLLLDILHGTEETQTIQNTKKLLVF